MQGLPGVTSADSFLTYNNPITIPTQGETFLNFLDWDTNEGDDNVIVEVSTDDGATWVPVYTPQPRRDRDRRRELCHGAALQRGPLIWQTTAARPFGCASIIRSVRRIGPLLFPSGGMWTISRS